MTLKSLQVSTAGPNTHISYSQNIQKGGYFPSPSNCLEFQTTHISQNGSRQNNVTLFVLWGIVLTNHRIIQNWPPFIASPQPLSHSGPW